MSIIIAFYQRGIPCHGTSVNEKPLGGTESAMIYTARSLARRGHHVFVFNEADQEGEYDGVTYRHWKHFEAFSKKETIDVFISIRDLLPLLVRRWAPVQIYFSPDAFDQPFVNRSLMIQFHDGNKDYEMGLYSLAFVQNHCDAIFCVGNWQAETFIHRFRIPPQKIRVTPNGVDLSLFPEMSVTRQRAKQIVYCSTPFRGLEFLLRYFPKIRERVSDATCVVMSGMQIYGMSDEEDRTHYQKLYELARQPGVILQGPLAKPAMAKVLMESRVLAYPNTFAETFCIAALEAQAAGLPVVTTALAGLKERVADGRDGFLIEGRPGEKKYEEEFVSSVVRLLKEDPLWETQSQFSRSKAEPFSYDLLAETWERNLVLLLEENKELGRREDLFVPTDQSCDVLVQGYPQRIHLSADLIRRYLAQSLLELGFNDCATKIRS